MKKLLNKISILTFTIIISFIGITNVNAASGSISVTSSTSKIVVGKEFSVTVRLSSGTKFGSWVFVIDYDKNKLKLISGDPTESDSADGIKSKSYTYRFKALSTGSATIGVKKNAEIYAYGDEKQLKLSYSSKTVKIITQAELEASYSKDNYLKSLSVSGLKLSPSFKKDVTEYTVEADSNTTKVNVKASVNDSKSKVSGTGSHEVSEGDNKIKVTVTAQNGSTRTYVIKVKVIDPNPIKVTIDGQELVVVKRESNLECPDGFEKKTIKINDISVPAFYDEVNDFTLVGLNGEDDIELYLYKDEAYTKYQDITLDQLKLYPLPMDKIFDNDYTKTETTINDVKFESYQIKKSDYSIIHARNLITGEDDYYIYDSKTDTVIRYTDENTKTLKNQIAEYEKLIMILGIESIGVILILVIIIICKIANNKKRKALLNKLRELESKLEEENKKKEVKEEKENKKKKKEVKK